jgi:hypothetical protein
MYIRVEISGTRGIERPLRGGHMILYHCRAIRGAGKLAGRIPSILLSRDGRKSHSG